MRKVGRGWARTTRKQSIDGKRKQVYGVKISSKFSSVPKCGFIDEDGGVAHTWHTREEGVDQPTCRDLGRGRRQSKQGKKCMQNRKEEAVTIVLG
jgi:hypothetical protein